MNRIDPEDVKWLARETGRQVGSAVRPHWARTIGVVAWRVAVLLLLGLIVLMMQVTVKRDGERDMRDFKNDIEHITERFEDQMRGTR